MRLNRVQLRSGLLFIAAAIVSVTLSFNSFAHAADGSTDSGGIVGITVNREWANVRDAIKKLGSHATYEEKRAAESAVEEREIEAILPPDADKWKRLEASFKYRQAKWDDKTISDKQRLYIDGVQADMPAAQAGILPDDYIVKVNDKSILGMTLEQVISEIRGEIGTPVSITVKREGRADDLTYKMTRVGVPTPRSADPVEAAKQAKETYKAALARATSIYLDSVSSLRESRNLALKQSGEKYSEEIEKARQMYAGMTSWENEKRDRNVQPAKDVVDRLAVLQFETSEDISDSQMSKDYAEAMREYQKVSDLANAALVAATGSQRDVYKLLVKHADEAKMQRDEAAQKQYRDGIRTLIQEYQNSVKKAQQIRDAATR